jgi:hypothetical protein
VTEVLQDTRTRALVTLGVDIGQMRDPTALAVTVVTRPAAAVIAYTRFLQRLPLGTNYPAVAERIQEVLFNLKNAIYNEGIAATKFHIFMDVTGVGRPIFDMLIEQLPANVRAIAVTLTGGSSTTKDGVEWHVPKQHLVSLLNRFMAERRLILPAAPAGQLTDEARQFQRELRTFVGRKESAQHVETGARQGAHDDLVIAVGLSLLNVAVQHKKPSRIHDGFGPARPRPVKGLPPYRGLRLYDDGEFR